MHYYTIPMVLYIYVHHANNIPLNVSMSASNTIPRKYFNGSKLFRNVIIILGEVKYFSRGIELQYGLNKIRVILFS